MTTATTATTIDLTTLPRPRVKLVGTDGNAFALLGRVSSALRKAGWNSEQCAAFRKEAMAGDYNNLLAVCCKYADVH